MQRVASFTSGGAFSGVQPHPVIASVVNLASAFRWIGILCALSVFGCGTEGATNGGKNDCESCSRDDECKSGYCPDFPAASPVCVSFHAGAVTECCPADNPALGICVSFHGTGTRTHGCMGTPSFPQCCAEMSGGTCVSCYCPSCLGCLGTVTGGSCSGVPLVDCPLCGANGACSQCMGCANGGPGQCVGTPFACGNWTDQATCEADGCTWLASISACSSLAMPTPCGALMDPGSCATIGDGGPGRGCVWSTCAGAPTPCDALSSDPMACGAQAGCSWVLPQSFCSGSLTPCEQLTSSTCSLQPGCWYQ